MSEAVSVAEFNFKAKEHPVKFSPGPGLNMLTGFIGRRIRVPDVFIIENTSDKPYPVYFEYLPGSWSYNGTPDMSKVLTFKVDISYKGKDYTQFHIENGTLKVTSGEAEPVTIDPGDKASVCAEVMLSADAREDDRFTFVLELIAPPEETV